MNDQEVINFLQQKIISWLGILISFVFYSATYFLSLNIYDLVL